METRRDTATSPASDGAAISCIDSSAGHESQVQTSHSDDTDPNPGSVMDITDMSGATTDLKSSDTQSDSHKPDSLYADTPGCQPEKRDNDIQSISPPEGDAVNREVEENSSAPLAEQQTSVMKPDESQPDIMVTFEGIAAASTHENLNVKIEKCDLTTTDDFEEKPAFNDMQTSSSSETSSDSESEYNDSDTNHEKQTTTIEDKTGPLVPGELTLHDLPPIEDLKITLDEKVTLSAIGNVESVVDCLVIVRAMKGKPPLNEESVLFREGRICLGKVFETFGRVVSPFYSVRFNTSEEIVKLDIKVGEVIYYAPKEDKTLTTYVFVSRLRQMKGSDASWNGNHEPPEKFLDYSDDEEEKLAKRKHKESKSEQNNVSTSDDVTEGQQGNMKKKSQHHKERNTNPELRRNELVRPAYPGFSNRQTRPGFPPKQQWRHQPRPCRPPPPGTQPAWIESHQSMMDTGFRGPAPRHPHAYHRFGAPPQHYGGGGPPPRQEGPRCRPPVPNYRPQMHQTTGWQSYGGSWTEQDSNYYTAESAPVPKTNFVDTRFVQQGTFTPDKK